ncbi:hypothetical protein [Roseospirillum parvum]|uniref:hypothetical protein n=1 Tax=Roseospirillum parvum TaxID=83401 RepID=UPI000B807B4A|nr:hypothetical protein [Roseospirillum parvum]
MRDATRARASGLVADRLIEAQATQPETLAGTLAWTIGRSPTGTLALVQYKRRARKPRKPRDIEQHLFVAEKATAHPRP